MTRTKARQTFPREEVRAATTKFFSGDELAANVWIEKYALSDQDGALLEKTPDDMFHRLASEFARIERKYKNPVSKERILEFLSGFQRGVAQGSPMAAIGNPYQLMSVSNCFAIAPPHDSYGGILLTDQELAQISKRRGGVGVDLSTLRPRGLPTQNAAKTTDGVAVFMERYSNTCREVAHRGRRGALMLTLSVHHPEIETFVNIKNDRTKVTGANVSVRLTDEFMQAVEADDTYEQRWPVDSPEPTIRRDVSARGIWEQIIQNAWHSGEPGVLFWSTATRETPSECYEAFQMTTTNPCSEIFLSAYDACRLFLLNLFGYVSDPYTSKAQFNEQAFAEDVQLAQRLMDDLVDLEVEAIDRILEKISADPEPEAVKAPEVHLWTLVKESCLGGRRTGLGITALGDTLAAMGVAYGSSDSIAMTDRIYQQLGLNAYRTTVTLAEERGPFEVYDHEKEKDHPLISRIMALDPELRQRWKTFGRRNIALTTTPPAGSVSLLTQTTSGLEPVYSLEYTRRRKLTGQEVDSVKADFVDQLGDRWAEYPVKHHGLQRWMDQTGNTNISESPYWGSTANDINWVEGVKLQAAAQKWVCHSISKTTNVPSDVSKETVADIYMTAWKSGCKGITVYRDGSRDGVLNTGTGSSSSTASPASTDVRCSGFETHHAPKRPEELPCDIYHMQVRGERWNFFVGLLENRPYEIFAGRSEFISLPRNRVAGIIRKNGVYNLCTGEGDHEMTITDLAKVFENPTESAFTRTVSLALRHGAPIQYVVEQLQKGADRDSEMFSLAKGLMRVLKSYILNGTAATSEKRCSQCDADDGLIYQEGCVSCKSCGYTKCS
jgi:ribonucleoside-diphosphate reductase alpha chain